MTLNVRSIANYNKRKTLFDWLNQKSTGIYLLQETHSTSDDIEKWQKEWNSKFYCSHGSTSSRGVAIVVPNSLEHDIHEIKTDNNLSIMWETYFIRVGAVDLLCHHIQKLSANKRHLKLLNQMITNIPAYLYNAGNCKKRHRVNGYHVQ